MDIRGRVLDYNDVRVTIDDMLESVCILQGWLMNLQLYTVEDFLTFERVTGQSWHVNAQWDRFEEFRHEIPN